MKAWGLTDVGMVREVNQDTYRMDLMLQQAAASSLFAMVWVAQKPAKLHPVWRLMPF